MLENKTFTVIRVLFILSLLSGCSNAEQETKQQGLLVSGCNAVLQEHGCELNSLKSSQCPSCDPELRNLWMPIQYDIATEQYWCVNIYTGEQEGYRVSEMELLDC